MNKGTILAVQSDSNTLEVLREHFEKSGYRVLATGDGAEALALARQELPQSIILDLDTPGLDAAFVVREVRATLRTRHIHITLLTPRSDRTDRLAGLSAGADEFLTKPIDVEELGLRVRNALQRAAFNNLTNPTTGLPGRRLIEEQLRDLLRRQDHWAILRLSLRGYRVFGDVYGFLAGEEVLRFAARLFGQVVDRLGTPADFLGHSGGDNFVLITAPEQVQALVADMSAQFADGVKAHYSFREREQGYILLKDTQGQEQRGPLMTLAAHAVTDADGPFYDIRDLTQALAA